MQRHGVIFPLPLAEVVIELVDMKVFIAVIILATVACAFADEYGCDLQVTWDRDRVPLHWDKLVDILPFSITNGSAPEVRRMSFVC